MSSHMYRRFVAIFLATLVLVAFSNVGLIADSHFRTLQRKPIPTTNTGDKGFKTKMADDKDIDDAIAAAKKAADEAKSKIKGATKVIQEGYERRSRSTQKLTP